DESGAPVPAASLTGEGGSTVTDVDGVFHLRVVGSPPYVLTIVADGYARQMRRLDTNAVASELHLTLRKLDSLTHVTLPSAGDAPVVAQVARGDAQVALSVPADALVDPTGAPAHGEADIALTFWHPTEGLSSAPANLLAANGNKAPLGLQTFGMADIEVRQNGSLLQVAAGKALSLRVVTAASLADDIDRRVHGGLPPNLYSLDPNTGLWNLETTLADGGLAYDPNTRAFDGKLVHLSTWNVDALVVQGGGCIKGHVQYSDGRAAATQPATLWNLGYIQSKAFRTTTDTNGDFCIDIGISSEGDGKTLYYYISGASPTESSMCNPMPSVCYECEHEADPKPYCRDCRFRNSDICDVDGKIIANAGMPCDPNPACNASSSLGQLKQCDHQYADSCKSPKVTMTACHFCPDHLPPDGRCLDYDGHDVGAAVAGGCADAGTLNLGQDPDPCAGKQAKHVGDTCSATDVCCPLGGLICADSLCVPASDP
ncbi:MAG TPA: carboxypeptidase-like regulatory domain-containing protein, partial [Myxococcota bacterium]|nr:carboxypeptidase-like regulatory domain-containing protein [Myxococcota bacterium]